MVMTKVEEGELPDSRSNESYEFKNIRKEMEF